MMTTVLYTEEFRIKNSDRIRNAQEYFTHRAESE